MTAVYIDWCANKYLRLFLLVRPGHSIAKRDEYDKSIKALTGYGPHADRQFKGDRSGAGIHTQLGFLFNEF